MHICALVFNKLEVFRLFCALTVSLPTANLVNRQESGFLYRFQKEQASSPLFTGDSLKTCCSFC